MSPRGRAPAPNFARTFWDDAYAADEDLDHWHREPPGAALLRTIAELRPGARILDLGCGRGGEACWLARRGFDVVGLELSLAALARAPRERAGRWRPVVGTALDLPIADGSVDLVLDAGCLHSIGSASRRLYAQEVRRVTGRGSMLLVRGACRDDEEAGLIGVSAEACSELFDSDLRAEWSLRLGLGSARGELEGIAVLWRRVGGGGRVRAR